MTKLENTQFSRDLKGNFYHLSLNGKNTPHSTILTKIPYLTLKLSQENSKNYVFEQILKHSLNFEPLPPPITNLIMPHCVLLIEVWLAKISFLNVISIQIY